MAFRRTYRKRSSTKRRFTRRFKRGGRRTSKRTGQKKFLVKRTVVELVDVVTALSATTTFQVPAATSQEFVINKLPSYSEFTNLFDAYKLCAIKQKFVFDRNSSEVVGDSKGLPTLLTVNDFNDSTAIANEDEILQYPSYKAKRMSMPITRYFKPRTLQSMASSNSAETRSQYLVCSSSADAVYYGLKWAIRMDHPFDAATSHKLGTLRIYTTYYMSFKNMK